MKPATNRKIAQVLEEIAEAMEIQGDNPFKIRAHRRAIETIEKHPQPIADLYEEGGEKALQKLPGIGSGISSKIAELLETGGLQELRRVDRKTPPALRELLHLPGVGPKAVKQLHDELKIKDLASLIAACEKGRVRKLSGFGEKKEAKILAAARAWEGRERRFLLNVADEYAETIQSALRKIKGVRKVEMAGSFRRRRESVGDLDILVTATDGEDVMGVFTGLPIVEEVVAQGDTKATVRLDNGMNADLRLVDPDCYGAALLYFSGSKQHNVVLRTRAKAKGYKISEYGVFEGTRRVAGATEEEIYELLGMDWIPPELREDRGELDAAAKGKLPRLVELKDIRGDLQTHSVGSDGGNTPKQMAEAAKKLGYEYIAITDHSKAVTVAGGMDDAQFVKWCKRLEKEDAQVEGIRILKGVELDILKDGSLDLKESTLQKLDYVVATVHSYFDLPRAKQTQRVVKAVRSGLIHTWGHPTARRIGMRDPIDVDLEEIFGVCAEENVAVEIDGAPERLDLHDANAMAAKAAGLKIVISTDAHSTETLGWMRYGVGMARRAWLTKKDILNTLPLEKFLRAIER